MLAAEPAMDHAEAVPESAGRYGVTEPFDEFYRCHLGKIYRGLALTLASDELAREAADEAMTRAYANWHKVSRLDNPAGWVFRVGLNWATSWWRKTRREQSRLADAMHPRTAGPDPAGLAARTAVERLPLNQRSVVVCRVLLELSTAETAAALAISEGTVKSRLSRALTALREALEECDEPDSG
jgi:DNA-directed RNA polymerase specialized sigma24 family protein